MPACGGGGGILLSGLISQDPRGECLSSSVWIEAYWVCFLSDLQASQSFEHYSISDKAMDYRILQMDEDQDRMYVGCKDHVLSMDINNITHGALKVSGRTLLYPNATLAPWFLNPATCAAHYQTA